MFGICDMYIDETVIKIEIFGTNMTCSRTVYFINFPVPIFIENVIQEVIRSNNYLLNTVRMYSDIKRIHAHEFKPC